MLNSGNMNSPPAVDFYNIHSRSSTRPSTTSVCLTFFFFLFLFSFLWLLPVHSSPPFNAFTIPSLRPATFDMQDLYAPSYPPPRPQWSRPNDHPYPQISTAPPPLYPPSSPNDSPSDDPSPPPTIKSHDQHQPTKSESKPQATFLTKLYA